MKKLFAFLLAIVIIAVPMTVMADDSGEASNPVVELYVGTVNALETPQGDGWSFDESTGVLTLNNCTLTESMLHIETDEWGSDSFDAMIYVRGDLTIELIGTNSIERVIEDAPTDYTQYFAICSSIYSLSDPGKLSFVGSGSLTVGIAVTADAVGEDGWLTEEWEEYFEYSSAIVCWAEGGADLTGLQTGGWMDIYGGIYGLEAPSNIRAFGNSPTLGDHCFVTAYRDVEGTIENEYGYNWNNNDAWRMKVETFNAMLQDNGMLLLGDSGSASGDGWTWENKVLTLCADTEVKAVSFKGILNDVKLVLAGDVTLDARDMGYDSNWNSYGGINASCDLEIEAGKYTLTVTADNEAIRMNLADLLISSGTVVSAMPEYCYSIYSQGGSVIIRNATFRTTCTVEGEDLRSGEIAITAGYDAKYNEFPAGDLLIENSVIDTIGSIYTNDGNITVKDSVLTAEAGYQAIGCTYADISFQNSDISIISSGTAIDASYGVITFDNCNLNLSSGEDEPLMLAARYYSYYQDDPEVDEHRRWEADFNAILFSNMNIVSPSSVNISNEENVGSYYTSGYITLKDDSDEFITYLKANGTKESPHEHVAGDWEVVRDATVDADGLKVRKCECGETLEEKVIPRVLTFASKTLGLKSNIALIFRVDPVYLTNHGYTNLSVVFNFNNKEYVVTDYTVNASGLYEYRFSDAGPHQMLDNVTAVIKAEFEGEVYTSEPLVYSIATYCYTQINALQSYPQMAKLVGLLVDMLNYGAADQQFNSYNTSNLANASLTAEQLAFGNQDVLSYEDLKDMKYATVENSVATFDTVALAIKDSIAVSFKFTMAAGQSIDGLVVRFEAAGKSWDIPASEFTYESANNRYVATIREINPSQMKERILATLYKDGVIVSDTASYSIESYGASTAMSIPSVKTLVEAMVRYGRSAKAYNG